MNTLCLQATCQNESATFIDLFNNDMTNTYNDIDYLKFNLQLSQYSIYVEGIAAADTFKIIVANNTTEVVEQLYTAPYGLTGSKLKPIPINGYCPGYI
jgi:hypothetical protein